MVPCDSRVPGVCQIPATLLANHDAPAAPGQPIVTKAGAVRRFRLPWRFMTARTIERTDPFQQGGGFAAEGTGPNFGVTSARPARRLSIMHKSELLHAQMRLQESLARSRGQLNRVDSITRHRPASVATPRLKGNIDQ